MFINTSDRIPWTVHGKCMCHIAAWMDFLFFVRIRYSNCTCPYVWPYLKIKCVLRFAVWNLKRCNFCLRWKLQSIFIFESFERNSNMLKLWLDDPYKWRNFILSSTSIWSIHVKIETVAPNAFATMHTDIKSVEFSFKIGLPFVLLLFRRILFVCHIFFFICIALHLQLLCHR